MPPSLEEMRRLEKIATPAPWWSLQTFMVESSDVDVADTRCGLSDKSGQQCSDNAEIIAAMRNLFPLLLDFVEAYDAQCALYARADWEDYRINSFEKIWDDLEKARRAIEEFKL